MGKEVNSRLIVELFAAGKAVPQPRAGPGNRGRMIMAPRQHAIRGWRDLLKMLAQDAMRGATPVSGALRMEILFLFARPKRLQTPELANDLILHTIRPDWDNIGKAASDAFKGVVWMDDCQVSTVMLRKRYALEREAPGVLVRVYHDEMPWIIPKKSVECAYCRGCPKCY